jgi:hypothetical protein
MHSGDEAVCALTTAGAAPTKAKMRNIRSINLKSWDVIVFAPPPALNKPEMHRAVHWEALELYKHFERVTSEDTF